MFKIAICDDECQFRKIIRELLTDYMNKNGVLYEIDEFSSGRELADLGIEINKYKIVFLDINMDAIIRKMNCVVKKKTFNFNEVTKNVPLERLLYIESRLHKLEFYIMEDRLNKYTLYSTLNDMEKELDNNEFLRIHQSYLVNMKHIEKVSRYEVSLTNGVKLEIPKARYGFVEKAYVSYKGEV